MSTGAESIIARVTNERREETCPICLERFPEIWRRIDLVTLYTCCGKFCCFGCHADWKRKNSSEANHCPLCRTRKQMDKEEEFARVRAHAENGVAWAEHRMGVYYKTGSTPHGSIVATDYDEAAKWFRKAADQGYFEAAYCLANLYSHGWGVPESEKESQKFYKLAAESRDAHALCLCGLHLPWPEGKDYLRQSAEQGHPEAMEELGVKLFGEALETKEKETLNEALPLVIFGAERGDAPSQFTLGSMLYCASIPGYFLGMDTDFTDEEMRRATVPASLYWLRKAASQGVENEGTIPDILSTVTSNCGGCGKGVGTKPFKFCLRCRGITYCSASCQVADWKDGHQKNCLPKNVDKRESVLLQRARDLLS